MVKIDGQAFTAHQGQTILEVATDHGFFIPTLCHLPNCTPTGACRICVVEVWGARTLAGNNDRGSEWKYVPVRRMALFIEESLYRGTKWVVFEPNDEPLWAQIRLNVGAFMQNLFR
ncbi:MAG TPA: 2Fe-2S iron-sulfur cluster-binding protein, partial [Spirochaetota bacterium]|nr:2Fe-2S iron-sulfur cluster-binding protein [Spirochaetota bacterium]